MNTNETMPEKYERQRKERAEFTIKAQTSLINNHVIQTCTNCEHWNDKRDICAYYDALPPPSIIVVGCAMHEFDIPF